jgi:hypothetical protein
MKTKIVSFKELTENNQSFCLSSLRVLGDCHKCAKFKRLAKQKRLILINCAPRVKREVYKLLEEKDKLNENYQKKHKEIMDKLNKL